MTWEKNRHRNFTHNQSRDERRKNTYKNTLHFVLSFLSCSVQFISLKLIIKINNVVFALWQTAQQCFNYKVLKSTGFLHGQQQNAQLYTTTSAKLTLYSDYKVVYHVAKKQVRFIVLKDDLFADCIFIAMQEMAGKHKNGWCGRRSWVCNYLFKRTV